VAGHDLGEHAELAHAACDQLRVLGAEVEDQDEGTGHGSQAQCLNVLRSVKTIASPRASHAAITSASRTEPPGWTIAVTPAAAAGSTLSANGKKPSLARAQPLSSWPARPAFISATSTASTR